MQKSCWQMYTSDKPNSAMLVYIMIDDHSNRSLASSQLFDALGIQDGEVEYMLESCSGKVPAVGRKANSLHVESIDRSVQIRMPVVIECAHLPDNRDEIPTPVVAESYKH